MQWDLIIRNAKVFDGTGMPGRVGDIAVSKGKIAARGGRLPSWVSVHHVPRFFPY